MTQNLEIGIKKTEPETVAFVSMKGPYDQIPEAFGRLYHWIQQKGYAPSGPPIGVYLNVYGQVPDSELLWELQSPLAGDVAPVEPDEQGLGVKKLESAEVASAVYKGPFEQIQAPYTALIEWIIANGYDIVGPSQEVYFTNPADTPPEELLTEIRFPVRKR